MKETHVHVLEDGTVLEHTHGEQEHVHTHDGTHPHHPSVLYYPPDQGQNR